MKRVFFSSEKPCPSSCYYCFAKWKDIYIPFPEISRAPIDEKKVIIYPCCDGDFFLNPEIFEKVKELSELFDEIYISISTKNDIDMDQLDKLVMLDHHLKKIKKGFVKISLSFSTKSMIERLEPNTLTYEKRIQLLSKLYDKGFNTSVIIKPLLPFISLDEYYEIVKDTPFIEKYVIGSLYVNINSDFYKEYIEKKYPVSVKPVNWLNSDTHWEYIDQSFRENELKNFINSNKSFCFDSDVELIQSFIV